jgi:hypothetical protein
MPIGTGSPPLEVSSRIVELSENTDLAKEKRTVYGLVQILETHLERLEKHIGT